MPTMTSSLCPTCGTPNPPHSLFCEKCGTRLIASLAEEPEEPEVTLAVALPKGLSLPTKPVPTPEPAPSAAPTKSEEELPNWMQIVQADGATSDLDRAKSIIPAQSVSSTEEIPVWITGLDTSGEAPSDDFGPAEEQKPNTDELLPEWTQRLRTLPDTAQPAAEDEVPDWLKTLGTTGHLPSGEQPPSPGASTPTVLEEKPAWLSDVGALTGTSTAEAEELPEWLKEHPQFEEPAVAELPPPPPVVETKPVADEMPDWLRDLGPAASTTDESLPDWLDELGAEEEPAPASLALSTGDSALDWLSQFSASAPELPLDQSAAPAAETSAWLSETQPAESVTPDWMNSLREAAPEVDSQPTEEVPVWLSTASAAETPAPSEISDWMSSFRSAEPAAESRPEEGVPNWLTDQGMAAPRAAADQSKPEAESSAEPVPTSKPVTDWLTSLRRATPDMVEEQAQAEEETVEIPEWLRESGAAPQAIGEPQAYEQEIPEWARESGTSVDVSEPPAAAQVEEEGVPDWLKGLSEAAVVAAQAEPEAEPTPASKPVTDWLSSLRQATPEMEAEQVVEEEAAEVPEWLREAGTAPQAIGEPRAYEQEVPEWARESGASAGVSEPPAAAQVEEEGVPDWLKGLGEAAVVAAQAEPEAEPVPASRPVTDWLSSLRQAAPEMEAEQVVEEEAAEIPEWLRESGAAPQAIGEPQAYEQEVPEWLREAGPTPSIASGELGPFETPTETTEEGEVPEWLRDLTPAAAVAAAMAQAEPEEAAEEPESSEEVEEPEPEAETADGVSEIAKAAVAGTAAVAALGAVKGANAEVPSAPTEMPSWLKELRQEQEAAQSTIQIPPAEAAELTQAEIPAWLEALRPKGQPLMPLGAETPSEAEGPLAGIANALPPALLMGQIQGAPMTLQFETSAEDLARAGVLKELLGQPTAAPAALEQFVVKSSAMRRRALRWTMAALIIFALLIPAAQWADFNALTGVDFLPRIDKMVPAPAVSKAVDEWKRLPANARVLVVFDYDATQAGELDRIAHLIMSSLAISNTQIEVASLNPQGLTLAQGVWQKVSHKGSSRFAVLDLAPAQASGVQDILARAGKVDLVIELAASPDTVRWWAEQMAVNRLKTPLIAGISAGAEPLTMPYVQSGQVAGLISGWAGAIQYAKATKLLSTFEFTSQMQDYQAPLQGISLANYTLAVLIVIGLIAALFGGKRKGARS